MASEVTHRVKEGSATIALHDDGDYVMVTIGLGRARYLTAGPASGGVHAGIHLDDDAARELMVALAAFYAARDEHDELAPGMARRVRP